MKSYPDFKYETKIWGRGLSYIAGADEVGRGCFAGPVVAGAVIFPPNFKIKQSLFDVKGNIIKINDSKLLTDKEREFASQWIKTNAISWGVGMGSVGRINKKGIVNATNFAFRSAVRSTQNKLNKNIEYLLIDAFYIPYIKGFRIPKKQKRLHRDSSSRFVNQLAIIKGDTKSFSIAAGSIIAKVYRDGLMTKLGEKSYYRKYHWCENKGYGTKEHREAIGQYGATRYHRQQFIRAYLK
jgi:ribonuclease HII